MRMCSMCGERPPKNRRSYLCDKCLEEAKKRMFKVCCNGLTRYCDEKELSVIIRTCGTVAEVECLGGG